MGTGYHGISYARVKAKVDVNVNIPCVQPTDLVLLSRSPLKVNRGCNNV